MKIQDKIMKIQDKSDSLDGTDEERNALKTKLALLIAKEGALIEEIKKLEQQSIDSYKVDPQTELMLQNAADLLYQKYLNTESKSYVGENIVNLVMVDYQDKQLHVLVDEPAIRDVSGQSAPAIPDFEAEVSVRISVDYGSIEEIRCLSRTSNCSPMVGGIEIAIDGQTSDDASTLGFKAVDRHGNTGFVVAGHAVNVGDKVYQSAGGSHAGKVIREASSCDCAFIKSAKGINGDIYKNHRQVYDIEDCGRF